MGEKGKEKVREMKNRVCVSERDQQENRERMYGN